MTHPGQYPVFDESTVYDPSYVARFFSRRVGLLSQVSPAISLALARAASVRRLSRGAYLCRSGDPAREIWVLLEGLISVNRCSWTGLRRSIELMLPGDVFGLPALASPVYPSEIQASRDSLAVAIPQKMLQTQIERHPALAQKVIELLAQRLRFVETMLLLSTEPAEKRLAAALLYLFHKFGAAIPITRTETAEMAGITSETAIRLLKRLEMRRCLRRRPTGLVINCPDTLRHFMIGSCPGSMPWLS